MLDSEFLFHIGHLLIPSYSDGFSISKDCPLCTLRDSEEAFLNYDIFSVSEGCFNLSKQCRP